MPSIEQLLQHLAKDPRDPFTLYALAQEHAKRAEHERAVEYYDQCLACDASYFYAYFHKARSMRALGRAADARAVLRDGLAAARSAGDSHAAAEIEALLDDLE